MEFWQNHDNHGYKQHEEGLCYAKKLGFCVGKWRLSNQTKSLHIPKQEEVYRSLKASNK